MTEKKVGKFIERLSLWLVVFSALGAALVLVKGGGIHDLRALECFIGVIIFVGNGMAIFLPGAPILRRIIGLYADPFLFGFIFTSAGLLMIAASMLNRTALRGIACSVAFVSTCSIVIGALIIREIGTAVLIAMACAVFSFICGVDLSSPARRAMMEGDS